MKLSRFVELHSNMELAQLKGSLFIHFNTPIDKTTISNLLGILWIIEKRMEFFDPIYPSPSDPGAYFQYSTERSPKEHYWGMTLANQGWSGGIYQIHQDVLAQQLYNLISKEHLRVLELTDATLFAYNTAKSEERSLDKEKQLYSMHS